MIVMAAGALTFAAALAVWLRRRAHDPARARAKRFREYEAALRRIEREGAASEIISEAHSVLRRALAERVGARAMGAVGNELVALLRRGAGLAPGDAAAVADVFARIDAARYSGAAIERSAALPIRDDAIGALRRLRESAEGSER